MNTSIGAIGAIMRFPVKSILGEILDQCAITASGLEGDRAYALIDAATGRIASAKQPNLWRDLLRLSAKTDPDERPPRIVISDQTGTPIDLQDADVNARLSALLGREVRLIEVKPPGLELNRARPDEVLVKGFENDVTQDVLVIGGAAPEGGFFDFAPIHLMHAASLQAVQAAAPGTAIEAWRYRPNLVIENEQTEAFSENRWIGRRLKIGSSVELEIIAPTPRCAVPLLAHGALPTCREAVSVVNRLNQVEFPLLGPGTFPCLGAYATVVSQGVVRQGDEVSIN